MIKNLFFGLMAIVAVAGFTLPSATFVKRDAVNQYKKTFLMGDFVKLMAVDPK